MNDEVMANVGRIVCGMLELDDAQFPLAVGKINQMILSLRIISVLSDVDESLEKLTQAKADRIRAEAIKGLGGELR